MGRRDSTASVRRMLEVYAVDEDDHSRREPGGRGRWKGSGMTGGEGDGSSRISQSESTSGEDGEETKEDVVGGVSAKEVCYGGELCRLHAGVGDVSGKGGRGELGCA